MDIPKFNFAFIQKINVFKSYSSLLIPVVLVIVGGLTFIPTQLLSSRLDKQIEKKSISTGKQIRSLTKRTVAREQWKVEQAYQLAFANDANRIALLTEQASLRQLLSYKIFPEPKDTSALIFAEFGQRFRQRIDELIERVNACGCPTNTELEKSLAGSFFSRFSRRTGGFSTGSWTNLSEVDAVIIDVLCRAKAQSASVYANPIDLSGYEFWAKYEYTGRDKAIEDCWYWQLGYWIIEDVFDTIAACNSGSKSVFTSPVKRLVGVSFSGQSGSILSGAATEEKPPHYVHSNQEGLAEPWTTRVCNDDTDVVHFDLSVIVSAKAVLTFMQQLCSAKEQKFRGFFDNEPEQSFKHNQITILESRINPIDRQDEAHSLYRYGEDAVVELNLICEYISDKIGYDEIKPELAKKAASEAPSAPSMGGGGL